MLAAHAMVRHVRLQRGVGVAGVDPDVARRLARACHGGASYPTSVVATWSQVSRGEADELLARLADAGFLERQVRQWDGESHVEWATTVRGGALANASFLKPMTRGKAQWLLEGVLERASTYNADPVKPMWVDRIAVFGSFLDSDAIDFGDLDLQVELVNRPAEDLVEAKLAYARASGRSFSSFMDQLFWAEKEARQVLKNRSGYISIHTEDISRYTNRWEVVHERDTGIAG
jgi:hypothetical protein